VRTESAETDLESFCKIFSCAISPGENAAHETALQCIRDVDIVTPVSRFRVAELQIVNLKIVSIGELAENRTFGARLLDVDSQRGRCLLEAKEGLSLNCAIQVSLSVNGSEESWLANVIGCSPKGEGFEIVADICHRFASRDSGSLWLRPPTSQQTLPKPPRY
jgi:hypothetical protein